MSVRRALSVGLFCIFLFANLSVSATEPLEIRLTKGWIREAPPVSTTLAGYLIIENQSEQSVVIVGGRSPSFGGIEIHRTAVIDGVARMNHEERLVVPAGSTLRLQPGGYHLMLMKPERALKAGDRVPLELFLEGAGIISTELEVQKDDAR